MLFSTCIRVAEDSSPVSYICPGKDKKWVALE